MIAGDAGGKSVLVSAPLTQHELIAKVIADIDQAHGKEPMVVKVYSLKNADASGHWPALP